MPTPKKNARTAKPRRKAVKPPARRGVKADPRSHINAAAIIDALEQHVLGNKKMTATQVGAALALLKKTLPDAPAAPHVAAAKKDAPHAHEDALAALE